MSVRLGVDTPLHQLVQKGGAFNVVRMETLSCTAGGGSKSGNPVGVKGVGESGMMTVS
jgi:hypothetical protein